MRTKTLLLSAAALLAAGIVSSQAQAVYSQNIVGYASFSLPASFTLMTTPFQIGVTNGANEIFGTNLPDATQIYLWNSSVGKFVIDYYDTGGGFNPEPWLMSDDSTPTNPPILAPGQGFFVFPSAPVTNTFAGVVAVAVGATNNMALTAAFNFVGSVIPAGGGVTNSLINLTGMPDASQVYIWNQTTGKYIIDYYDTGGGFNPPPYWYMSDDSTPTNVPSLTVGQGMFIFPSAPYTWSETLPSQ